MYCHRFVPKNQNFNLKNLHFNIFCIESANSICKTNVNEEIKNVQSLSKQVKADVHVATGSEQKIELSSQMHFFFMTRS